MSGPSFAITVSSLHGRCGKTLLARVIAEYFFLSGEAPYLFDTDLDEHPLHAIFPHVTLAVNLALVRHQMAVFDTLAKASAESRIVDLTHRSFRTYFELMRETDFVVEARAHGVEPVIFFIPDHKLDSWEAAVWLKQRFADCTFVVVENAFLGASAGNLPQSAAAAALAAYEPRLLIPGLSPALHEAIEQPGLSLSEFMRRPLSYEQSAVSDDLRKSKALRAWLLALFQGIHRVTALVSQRAGSPAVAQAAL